MSQIIEYLGNITSLQIMDVVVAICIIVLFKIFSPTISYIIIRMFKIRAKNKKVIKESAFYKPLAVFFTIFGIYISIVFLKVPLAITDEAMQIVKKIFEIVSVIAFARGLAASFEPKSSLVKKMKEKTSKDVEDSMFDFILKIVRAIIYIVAGFIVITLLGV